MTSNSPKSTGDNDSKSKPAESRKVKDSAGKKSGYVEFRRFFKKQVEATPEQVEEAYRETMKSQVTKPGSSHGSSSS